MADTAPAAPSQLWDHGDDRYGPNSFKGRLEAACTAGDLKLTHALCAAWLLEERPDPVTGYINVSDLRWGSHCAVKHNNAASLAYICQRGNKRTKYNDIFESAVVTALQPEDTRCLQVLLDYGWDINEGGIEMMSDLNHL